MERGGRQPHIGRIRSHLVAREQAAITVEQGVLHRLRRDGRRQLLKPRNGIAARSGLQYVAETGRCLPAEPSVDEVQHRMVDRREPQAGLPQSGRHIDPVLIRPPGGIGIGAIDRKGDDQFVQRTADRGERDVAGVEIGPRHAMQGAGGDLHLGPEAVAQHLPPRGLHVGGIGGVVAGRPAPDVFQRVGRTGIVQHACHLVHEVVAGRTIHRPAFRQLLAPVEDFLDHQIAAFRGFRRAAGIELFKPAAQAAAITGRVGNAVHMVHAEAVHDPFRIQTEQEGVGALEHVLPFHLHAGQFGDVEEAPPVQVVIGRAPPG